jgi:putative cardiolipin synthase
MSLLKLKTLIPLALCFALSFQVQANSDGPFLAQSNVPHPVTILNDGPSAFEMRLRLIEEAKKTIDIEYFIYNTDTAGRLFTQALVKRAKEGVKVRLLLDHFMVGAEISPFHSEELKKVGVEVRFYNTIPLFVFNTAQYRNHRKSLMIDGKKAIFGGRNIADEYFDLDHEYNFLDRDILIEGPIVKSAVETFDIIWKSEPVKQVKRDKRPTWSDLRYMRARRSNPHGLYADMQADQAAWDKYVAEAADFIRQNSEDKEILRRLRTLGTAQLANEVSGVCPQVVFSSDRPSLGSVHKREDRVLKYEIFRRMKELKEKLIIDSPYFILEKVTGDILEDMLVNRGVSVTLLTNGLYSTDASYVASVFNARVGEWIEKGLSTHIYSGNLMPDLSVVSSEVAQSRWGTHSKSFVFDETSMMIGSYNFDPRSNLYSLEQGIFCDGSKELAAALEHNVNVRIANSIYLKTPEDVNKFKFDRIGFLKRLGYYLVSVPAALLDHLL